MKQKVTITGLDPLRLDLYSQHLTNLGYTPTAFISGLKKENQLDYCSPVVLIEYQAASVDNFAFIRQLKEKMPATYVIIIAGKNDFEEAHQAIGTKLFNVIVQTRYFFTCINEILQNVARVPFVSGKYPGKMEREFEVPKIYLN